MCSMNVMRGSLIGPQFRFLYFEDSEDVRIVHRELRNDWAYNSTRQARVICTE